MGDGSGRVEGDDVDEDEDEGDDVGIAGGAEFGRGGKFAFGGDRLGGGGGGLRDGEGGWLRVSVSVGDGVAEEEASAESRRERRRAEDLRGMGGGAVSRENNGVRNC